MVVSDHRVNLREGRSNEAAGKAFSISGTSVDFARKILDFGVPALIAKVDEGEMAVSVAAKIAEHPTNEQTRLLTLSRGELAQALRGKPNHADANDSVDDELLKRIHPGRGSLTKDKRGFLRLELSRYDTIDDLAGMARDTQNFMELLDRGVYVVRRQ